MIKKFTQGGLLRDILELNGKEKRKGKTFRQIIKTIGHETFREVKDLAWYI